MKRRLIRAGSFIVVGSIAAAVHLGVVMALVEGWRLAPLRANVGGWLVAFVVSFLGQWRLTFRDRQAPLARAVPRLFTLSLLGFAINQSAYALALHLSGWRYDILLAGVLVGVAVMTYLLGSRWAFRGNGPADSIR